MRIVHLAVEFSPLVKAGGLGDVLEGLCAALTKLDHNCEAIIPKYDFIDLNRLTDLEEERPHFSSQSTMYRAKINQCKIKLLDSHHPKDYFKRGKLYGCEDDTERFLHFARTCIEYLKIKNEPIDILHLHDWHVAIAALLVKELNILPIKKVIFTIHNGAYQGLCSKKELITIGLEKCQTFKNDDPKEPEAFNLMKSAIVYADAVNTVSPSYAEELLEKNVENYLWVALQKYADKFCGILNGIDHTTWNPVTDPSLQSHYSAKGKVLEAKEAAKSLIRDRFRKKLSAKPWVGAITRLVPQKGPELLIEAIRVTKEQGGTFVLLGSSPIPMLQRQFDALQKEYEEDPNVLFYFKYDETLAHQLYAALDFFIIPSIFEPCGLTQLIAMRYGTVPIVRATGGLKDTIIDLKSPDGNGFTFENISSSELKSLLERAIKWFHKDAQEVELTRQKIMQQNFGWEISAHHYIDLYKG